ncbi:hypothetical protein HYH02_002740 [Chlamydomonas schloesseri]|uniref:Uncharacterized protein n=1 Tax=Chlamydomonas schloesseri TaxID=2026947 RepID=A0A835WRW9_9CHLO|nr:hypothetical protein HYH02_002740 [Chlamydomonas schloesseri]|eukprot:KAG2452501.1 hypothetical protein HYH02_002740 [Chlamydomonas schloesseri]
MAKRNSLRVLHLLVLCVGAAFADLSQEELNSGDPGASLALGLADGGLGLPISAWYFSLKTSKGYCGLLPLSTAAGGYGFAISCANKYPVYDSQFTLLAAEAPPAAPSGGSGWADAASQAAGTDTGTEGVGGGVRRATAAVAAAEAGQQGLSANPGLQEGLEWAVEVEAGQLEGQPERRGSMTDEALRVRRLLSGAVDPRAHTEHDAAVSRAAAAAGSMEGDSTTPRFHDPNAPVVVISGTPLRLLSRTAGLCGSVPTPGRGGLQQQEPEQEEQPQRPDNGDTWYAWLRCQVLPALQWALNALSRALRLPIPQPFSLSLPTACGTAGGAAGHGAMQVPRVGDTAPWPVTCVLAQPGSLQWRLFKSDLKDNATVDLAADWLYLMEGDKYCTLADVAGMTAVVSCHLDAPGWTGYKFQLQTLSYPRSQLASQLTGGDCSVRLPSLPPPHDWACGGPGQPPAPDRSPDFDLVLQTPGSALAAGVVVGITTYSHGLVGNQLQRCCPMTSSPHIIFCEIPAPGSAPPGECWFQLYDVKLVRSLAGSREDPGLLSLSDRGAGGGGTGGGGRVGSSGGGVRQGGGFWGAFARRLFEEMAPVGLPGMQEEEEEEEEEVSSGVRVVAPGVQAKVGRGKEDAEFEGGQLEEEEEEEEVGLVTELAAAAGRLRFPWDAVTPITDGSLVMFMSKAFARYCSVSVDGDLLCVSAQASNASRNLFTLRLPPLAPLGGAGRRRELGCRRDVDKPLQAAGEDAVDVAR